MRRIAVVAPHPDDEVLGCGGSLLRYKSQGDELHWIIVTAMTSELGYADAKIRAREAEIASVARRFGFASVTCLGFPTTTLSGAVLGEMVACLGKALDACRPEWVLGPYYGDVHSDHRIVFDAIQACCKPFRNSFVKKVLCYETLSETEQGIMQGAAFAPNLFVDITGFVEEKISILRLYESELQEFPFPRSVESVKALATFRGSMSGVSAAEAFMLLREIQ